MAAKQNESYVPPPKSKSFEIPKDVLCEELKIIHKRRKAVCCESADEAQVEANPDPKAEKTKLRDKLVGLALSGGGIRSATFSLGVLQKLAKEDCLKHVDYLSTVSGGGYIGGSLTWLLSDKVRSLKNGRDFRTTSDKFPYGVEAPREERLRENESNILKHLRLHGKYLIPGKGITPTSLIAVILRGILLNLLVWLPLVVLLMVMLMRVSHVSWDIICNALKEFCLACWDDICNAVKEICQTYDKGELDLLLYFAGVMGILFLLASIGYSLATRKFILKILKDPYLCRRKFEKWIRWVLWIGLGLLVVGSIPAVAEWLKNPNTIGIGGIASLLLGIVSGLWSFYRSGHNVKEKIPLSVLAPIASILLLYGLAWASYELAASYLRDNTPWLRWVIPVSAVISLVTGWWVNLNYIWSYPASVEYLGLVFQACD